MSIREFTTTGFSVVPVWWALSTVTSRSPTAVNHWVGGNFIAPVTDTIDLIRWRTGTITSPVMTITASITQVDTNGYPLGTAISTATGRSSFAASTVYDETVSAAVTRGTLYGVKLEATSFTSGTLNINHTISQTAVWGTHHPYSSHNLGTATKNSVPALIGVRYQNAGWVPTPGLGGPIASTTSVSINTVGHCMGNTFQVTQPEFLTGYLSYIDADSAFEFCLYEGTTEVTAATTTVPNTPGFVNAAFIMVPTPTPILLKPYTTYRVVVRATNTTALQTNAITSYGTDTIKMFTHNYGGVQKTIYNGSTWTDTATDLLCVCAVLRGGNDDLPNPTLIRGF